MRLGMQALFAAAVALGAIQTQTDGFDETAVALIYHKRTGEPLDFRAIAERSEAARRVSGFDRPDAIAAEVARLKAQLDAAEPSREFVLQINDMISEYDHDHGHFSIALFAPGHYVPVRAFEQEYKLVFANADGVRPIAMPKEEARAFDAKLASTGRRITNEIRFRVIGAGDPAGAVTGDRVIRAEILAARLLDEAGRVLFTPNVKSAVAAAAGASVFDVATADVAGFRVGVAAKDLEATLTRLFGPVTRRSPGENAHPGFAAAMAVNEMGCFSIPGRRENPDPGAVCVTAFLDRSDVVRAIRMERLFDWLDPEIFRQVLVRRYGPVAGARTGSSFALGWGPEVDAALLYDRTGPQNALTAHYVRSDDWMSRGGNRLPEIRVVLYLVDAEWASERSR